jgi:nucleotide-binding universal stress UspA family protein
MGLLSPHSVDLLLVFACPVAIGPAEEWHSRHTGFQRLLVCLDGSGCAESSLRYAMRLAEEFACEITLLGVPESDLEKTQLLKYIEKVAQALRADHITAKAMVTGSGPARTIVELSESEDIDLVILTRSGRGNSQRHAALGSVANRVSQTTQRPLLLVGGSKPGGARWTL